MDNSNISFQLEFPLENANLIDEMSKLYSEHYGFWGQTAPNPGKRIQLSPKILHEWIKSDYSYIATARDIASNELLGYAISIKKSKNKTKKLQDEGIISWITQLVVHQEHRNINIGKTLLFSFWGFSNNFAWGIMSSNPYAIRALEKATSRTVDLSMMLKKQNTVKKFGIENVHYLDGNTEFVITEENSKVNTHFPSDLSKVDEKIANVSKNSPWQLGNIDEGWEWFAFTFQEQDMIKLSVSEIEEMLKISEDIAHRAYSKMLIKEKNHTWAKHTSHEIDFIVKTCKLNTDMKIADFGCGIGRHTIELYNRGYNVIGVDYSQALLNQAKQIVDKDIFIHADCREIEFTEKYNAIICLYDVIGSFIDEKDNQKLIHNISKNLHSNGYAVISVMNLELTKHIAKNIFSLKNEPNEIFKLTASNTMEQSGNIFNPNFFMIDKDSNIVFRREQFSHGSDLPQELIVRDRRYSMEQIIGMCEAEGLKVIYNAFVKLGAWNERLQATDNKAKEILLVCQKI